MKYSLSVLFFILSLMLSGQQIFDKRIYHTTKITGQPPVIDALLDDVAWTQVNEENNFIQRSPFENAVPSQKTSFKILYDENNIYVAIRAYDTEPDKIITNLARRDVTTGDIVLIQFDSYGDKLTGFEFAVSAAGVKSDGFFFNDGNNEDMTPDPIWYVKTRIDSLGWVAEMKIPLNQLRFSKTKEQEWGLQVGRYLYRKEEFSWWQHVPRDAAGWVHNMGILKGIHNIKPKKQFEVQPYVVGKHESYKKDHDDPFSKGKETTGAVGVDGKIGLTNHLTLDFTINPDFGQVEADPSEVNLSGFESYYQEKRPFFVEGNNITSLNLTPGNNNFSLDNLFYSRRIGRPYQRDMDDFDYIDAPENTTILGAFKLTGKTRKGLSVGVLESITRRETADAILDGEKSNEVVTPFTNYFVTRVQKDFDKGNTRVGGMFTATNRDINNPDLKFLPSAAYTGGIDFDHSWKDKTYNLSIKAVFSHVQGDSLAITRLQRSSVRYFQRPDASYVHLDSSRKELNGQGGIISFSKSGKGHWNYTSWINWRSPGLELNDVGYLRRTDDVFQVIWVGYHYYTPFSIYRQINVNFNQWSGWDFGGYNTYYGGNVSVNSQFINYWWANVGINIDGNNRDNSILRGGPSMKVPGGWNYWWSVSTDGRKKLTFDMNNSCYFGFEDYTHNYDFGISLNYRPVDALRLSLSPSYNINKSELQYIDEVQYGSNKRYILSDKRYILGTIDQTTFRLSLRLDYCITPNLTIQYYGQPFICTGKYTHLKRITSPKAYCYANRFQLLPAAQILYDTDDEQYLIDENLDGVTDYVFDKPDFKELDFLSNLVIRWEYIPGSTVFLVWSQNRNDSFDNGNFIFDNDMKNIFRIYPHNIFMLKFSYRIRV